jgi:hypothetical protein
MEGTAMQQIIQFFRRPPSKRAPRQFVKRPLPLRKTTDELDELFAKLAAVPRIRKTPVQL